MNYEKYEEFIARVLHESFGQKLDKDTLRSTAKKVAKVIEGNPSTVRRRAQK